MSYENTTVTIEKSQGEIRKLLRGHGASAFQFSEGTQNTTNSILTWAAIEFAHQGRRVRMYVPFNPPNAERIARKARNARTKTWDDFFNEDREQEGKRIWRVIYHNLKARMVSVEEGVETFEEAFLAHMVNEATNRTIYEDLSTHGTVELAEPMPRLMLPSGER